MIEIKRYTSDCQLEWDAFIENAMNSSFLFKRNYLEYHSDRFQDHSLMIYIQGVLSMVLPANIVKSQVVSHQGLTYGGFVFASLRLQEIIATVTEVLRYLNKIQIDKLILKPIPRIYHKRQAEEIDWILFKLCAKLYRRDTSFVIDNRAPKLSYQERRRRAIKKASSQNVEIKAGAKELNSFWNEVLVPNLLEKHGIAPVHTLNEIELLASRFPENINQYNIYLDGKVVAGCTMYLNESVAHAQYISGSNIGRNSGSLDYLFDHLIKNEFANYNYFDFGICNEQNGQLINVGLLEWKEGFGAKPIVHDFYKIETKNYHLLTDFKSH